MHKKLLIVAAAGLLLAGCSKDKDAPEITINSPADETVFAPGDEVQISATFTDNEALSEYHLDIHEAGGHSHGKTEAEWGYEKTGSLSGTEQSVSLSVNIPTDAELGAYHITFECLDEEGNEADKTIEIDVE